MRRQTGAVETADAGIQINDAIDKANQAKDAAQGLGLTDVISHLASNRRFLGRACDHRGKRCRHLLALARSWSGENSMTAILALIASRLPAGSLPAASSSQLSAASTKGRSRAQLIQVQGGKANQ